MTWTTWMQFFKYNMLLPEMYAIWKYKPLLTVACEDAKQTTMLLQVNKKIPGTGNMKIRAKILCELHMKWKSHIKHSILSRLNKSYINYYPCHLLVQLKPLWEEDWQHFVHGPPPPPPSPNILESRSWYNRTNYAVVHFDTPKKNH